MGGILAGVGNWISLSQGHFGRFEIDKIWAEEDGRWLEVYNRKSWFHRSVSPLYIDENMPKISEKDIYKEILWLTPFCFKKKHKEVEEISLTTIIYFIMCRLSTLQCKKYDFNPALQEAEKATLVSQRLRYIATRKGRDNSYKTGNLIYDAIPSPLIPLLVAGSLVHLGKGTRSGNGTYCLKC